MENEVHILEQHSIKNVIILSLKTNHKPSSCRANPPDIDTDGNNAPDEELETLENQALGYLNNKLNIDINSCDISACHVLNVNKHYGKHDPKKSLSDSPTGRIK